MTRFVALSMNWVRVILKHKHFTGILFGIFAGLIILSNQSLYYNLDAETAEQTKKELADQEEGEEIPAIKVGQEAITSVVQVILVQAIRSVTDILFSDDNEVKHTYSSEVSPNSYFKALFNLIISPNAP